MNEPMPVPGNAGSLVADDFKTIQFNWLAGCDASLLTGNGYLFLRRVDSLQIREKESLTPAGFDDNTVFLGVQVGQVAKIGRASCRERV